MRIGGRLLRLVMATSFVLLGALALPARAQTPTIVALRLNGVVDPLVADYLSGSVQRAQDTGAAAVLVEIDTPGGLDSSMRQITQSFLNANIPLICYVAPSGARAASAGAFILMSCPVAAMAPGTNVGAATPIGLTGGDLSSKIANDAANYIRALAEAYDRNADVAATFVTDATSITAEDALNDNVIDLIAPTPDALLSDLDGTTVALANGRAVTLSTANATIDNQKMGAFVGFLHALLDPNLAFIFFWLGLALIVLEIIVPGHIFSGTVGTAMLLTSLFSLGLLPVRLIGIVFLIVSVAAFVLELKAPGLGIWGAVGVISLLLGGWFLFDRSGGVSVSPWTLGIVAAFAALFFGFVVAKAIQIRHMPPPRGRERIIGEEGVAIAGGVDPRGGQVRVDAEAWRAVAPAGPIAPGAKVRVTALEGLVLTVEPLSDEHARAGGVATVEAKSEAKADEGGIT
jgi:membrane-bound serine protease (ClpP class)